MIRMSAPSGVLPSHKAPLPIPGNGALSCLHSKIARPGPPLPRLTGCGFLFLPWEGVSGACAWSRLLGSARGNVQVVIDDAHARTQSRGDPFRGIALMLQRPCQGSAGEMHRIGFRWRRRGGGRNLVRVLGGNQVGRGDWGCCVRRDW